MPFRRGAPDKQPEVPRSYFSLRCNQASIRRHRISPAISERVLTEDPRTFRRKRIPPRPTEAQAATAPCIAAEKMSFAERQMPPRTAVPLRRWMETQHCALAQNWLLECSPMKAAETCARGA